MSKINKAAVSYHEELVESLRGDEEAQIEYIKANFEDNGDMLSSDNYSWTLTTTIITRDFKPIHPVLNFS